MSENWAFETKQIHAARQSDPVTGATAVPIYQSTSFEFPSVEEARDRFQVKKLGPIYTRLGNPTNDAVEGRISALEGGVGALFTASGQAAQTLAILNLASKGNNIVASPSLYGGTANLFRHSLPKLGIEVRFVEDARNREQWLAQADENTVAFYGETIPNPQGDILDFEVVAGAAHEVGVPLIVDNTVATPYLCRPFEHGADIVVHSATKYLGGHGTALGGFIVDSGKFDFGKDPKRFPGFNEPDPSYNGIVYARDLGEDGPFGANVSFILKARLQGQRDFGFSASPFNAFLIEQGIETLSLRMERHVHNAQIIAEYLENHPQVESVNYAGLKSSPHHELAKKYTPKGPSSLLSFVIKGGFEPGRKFVDNLKLFAFVANLGDVHSLSVHPASTTHSQLTEEELAAAGIDQGTVRLSVGTEHSDDLIADLEAAFKAARE